MYNLCCISNELKTKGISFQTMTWKRYNELQPEEALLELGKRWFNNVVATQFTIDHCGRNGWGYRVSSSLFPLLTHPEFKYKLTDIPQYKAITSVFESIHSNNKSAEGSQKVRLSIHPDQFNVLASTNAESVAKTIKELNSQGLTMDLLGCERSRQNPINIHINCSQGDISEIAARFAHNLEKCDDSVTSRLVVENEDKGCWNVENLLNYLYHPYKIPITFDNLHDKCNPSKTCLNDFGEKVEHELCAATWGDIKPIFHYSESDPNNKNPRAHADMPIDRPFSECYDWDIELKAKDKAIRMLR